MIKPIKNLKLLLLAILCLLVVCVLDFLIPPDVVIGILYISAILLVRQESTRTIFCFLIIASLMNISNFIYFARNTSSLSLAHLVNSMIVLFGMCVITLLVIRYKQIKDYHKEINLHLKELK